MNTRNEKNFHHVTKALAAAKEDRRKLTEVMYRADHDAKSLARIPENKRNEKYADNLKHAENWVRKVEKMIEAADINIRHLEQQLEFIKRHAKGCTTPSGKTIRV